MAALMLSACGGPQPQENADSDSAGQSVQQRYSHDTLVSGSDFHGIHGITEGPDGALYAGSVVGQSIYRIDRETGTVTTEVEAPAGSADDLVFGPNGQLYWTDILRGQVKTRNNAGDVVILANNLPGANAIDFHPDGRLFVTQVFQGDALNEIDPAGVAPPRQVIADIGGLNGFEIGQDGFLYGPLWFRDQVVKINVDTGELNVVTDGIDTPAAVNFGIDGALYVAENATGQIFSVDIKTGEKQVIAATPSNPDNIAVTASGDLFVTHMSDNSITQVNLETGELDYIIAGGLALPGGLAAYNNSVFVADTFSLRQLSLETGAIVDIERVVDRHGYPLSVGVIRDKLATSSWSSGTVQLYDARTGESIGIKDGFVAPYDFAAGPDNSFYVAEFGTACIVRVEFSSDARDCVVGELAGPVGLAVGEGGRLYISESLAGRITVFDPESENRSILVDGLSEPEGIALDGDFLVVAEVGMQRVLRISIADGSIETIGEVPMGLPGVEGVPPAFVPTGVAISDGHIIVSSDVENAIYRFSK